MKRIVSSSSRDFSHSSSCILRVVRTRPPHSSVLARVYDPSLNEPPAQTLLSPLPQIGTCFWAASATMIPPPLPSPIQLWARVLNHARSNGRRFPNGIPSFCLAKGLRNGGGGRAYLYEDRICARKSHSSDREISSLPRTHPLFPLANLYIRLLPLGLSYTQSASFRCCVSFFPFVCPRNVLFPFARRIDPPFLEMVPLIDASRISYIAPSHVHYTERARVFRRPSIRGLSQGRSVLQL